MNNFEKVNHYKALRRIPIIYSAENEGPIMHSPQRRMARNLVGSKK